MSRSIFFIPFAFATICLVLALYAGFGFGYDLLVSKTGTVQPGEGLPFEPVHFEADKIYKIAAAAGIAVGDTVALSVSLVDAEGAALFELEDSYWSEAGTWSEGGESGSWAEDNSTTTFEFMVPETGEYQLNVELEAARGATESPIRADLLVAEPAPFGAIPLLVGALLFALVGGFLWTRRGPWLRQLMCALQPGSIVRVEGASYTIEEIRTHFDPEGPLTYEWRLRGEDRSVRFLGEEFLEYQRGENDKVQHLFLMEEPLSSTQEESLEEQEGSRTVLYQDGSYNVDRNNSGRGEQRSEGERAGYEATLFMSESLPLGGGKKVIEFDRYDDGRSAWSVMRALRPEDVRIVKTVKMSLTEA